MPLRADVVAQIERYCAREEEPEDSNARELLGSLIQVTGGAFEGRAGVCTQIRGMSARIILMMFGREVRPLVPLHLVEKIAGAVM